MSGSRLPARRSTAAPNGTGVRPRVKMVTSQRRASAASTTWRPRNCVPPRTSNFTDDRVRVASGRTSATPSARYDRHAGELLLCLDQRRDVFVAEPKKVRVDETLVHRFPHIEVHNEICLATQERQEAAVLAADHVDCVVVVGSRRSSNSLRLAQVVQEKAHKPAHLVDNATELDPAWFAGMNRIGVTAGASTPTHITREVIAAIEAISA